ncbi:MAG: NUDIX hydrolase [Butyrivibrio sp.]|nr:NUDIX hydrolase [Butyrivibrio sp.]
MTQKKDKNGLTEKEFLKEYKAGDYDRPSVTADILVLGASADLRTLKILLVKRDEHPHLDRWALPGGFVRGDETAFQAAQRKLSNETGLEGVYLDQIYTFTRPDRDPRTRVMTIAYLALVSDTSDDMLRGVTCAGLGEDTGGVRDAAWFDLVIDQGSISFTNAERNVSIEYSIENKRFKNGRIFYENWVSSLKSKEELAFDHIEIIIESFIKLKAEFEHTDLAFNMMGDTFTLPDLQALYELVLGKKLYKTNFRAMVAPKVDATGAKMKSISSNKMSAEYRYKEAAH